MANTRKAGDLYIASNVDVVRGTRKEGDREVAVVKTIAAGQMVSDTDLKANEIKELKRAGVLRYPTPQEQEVMDSAADRKTAEEAAEKQADLAAQQEIERQRLAAEQADEAEKERQKLAAEQEKERAKAAGEKGGKK